MKLADTIKNLPIWVKILAILYCAFLIFALYNTCIANSSVGLKDWLMFSGSALGGVAAFCAIWFSYTQNEEYHQREIMPFIVLSPVEVIDGNIFCYKIDNDNLESIPPILRISAGEASPVSVRKTTYHNISELVKNMCGNEYYSRKLIFKNIGGGNAYDIRIDFQNQQGISGLILTQNEEFQLLLEIDNTHSGTKTENYSINIDIEYSDLAGRRYMQHTRAEVNGDAGIRVPAPTNIPPLRK